MRAPGAIAIAALLAGVLLAGCGGDPKTKQYVFNERSSPVKVDTPALRQQKAAAGIEPCPQTTAEQATSPRSLPDITLPCLGGGRDVDLAGLRGPLLVNFWAQNCGPCRVESPAIQQVYDQLGGRLGVIGVDWQDTQPDQALAFAQAYKITYPQLADPGGATRAPLEIQGLPYTFFVTRTGAVAYVNKGPIGSVADLRAMVEKYLGVSSKGLSS